MYSCCYYLLVSKYAWIMLCCNLITSVSKTRLGLLHLHTSVILFKNELLCNLADCSCTVELGSLSLDPGSILLDMFGLDPWGHTYRIRDKRSRK